jgi:hypothetical protein
MFTGQKTIYLGGVGNLSPIPDAAIIIVTYNFSDSPGQRCESIEFFGFR